MADRLKEAIQIVLETEGLEGIDQLRDALAGVGTVSAETVRDTEKLLDSLNGLNEAAAGAARYDVMTEQLQRTQTELDQASKAAYQLSLQLGATEAPTRQMQSAQKAAAEEVQRLELAVTRQWSALQREDDALQRAGVNTADLANEQRALRGDIARTSATLEQQVGSVRREAEALRELGDRLEEGDEAYRKFMRAGRVSGEALAAYKQRAAAAAAEQRQLNAEATRSTGIFGRMRGAIAGIGAYFGIREAAQAVGGLLKVASASESAKRSLSELYGTQAAGNRAFGELKTMARANGVAFQGLLDDAKKLKGFGLDPLNGSMQALVDQNAAVGGSQEQLSRKVLALGQAWSKQRLQAEEVLQLTEAGLPVMELLETVTGKAGLELSKMMEQGRLGRDVIKSLYEEIGRVNVGAAERGLGTLSGLLQQARARWEEFQISVADNGLTEYFKQQITALLGSTRDMDGVAKRVASGIKESIEALKSFAVQMVPVAKMFATVTGFVARHAAVMVELAKVYAAFKVASAVASMARWRTVLTGAAADASAASKATSGLGAMLGRLPGAIAIPVALLGIEAAQNILTALTLELAKSSDAAKQAGEAVRGYRDDTYNAAIAARQTAAAHSLYKDVVVQTTEQIGNASRAEQESYAKRLLGLREYQKAQLAYLVMKRDIGLATDDEIKQLARLQGQSEEAKKSQEQLALALAGVAKSADSAAVAFAATASVSFDKLIAEGKSAREAITSLLGTLDVATPAGAQKLMAFMDEMAGKGSHLAKVMQDEVIAMLLRISQEDLPAALGAIGYQLSSGADGADRLAAAVKSINLRRLGVDVEGIQTGFSKAGKAALDMAMGSAREIKALGLTAVQQSKAMTAAFDAAFAQIGTSEELRAFKGQLQEAVSAGLLGFNEYSRLTAEVNSKLAELAKQGAYAPKALNEGLAVGNDNLREMAAAAAEAAREVEGIGEAGQVAASGVAQVESQAASLAFTTSGVSDEFIRLIGVMDNLALGNAFRQQEKDLYDALRATEELNGQFDEMAAKRRDMQKRYPLVNPATVDQLVQAEQKLADNRKRVQEVEQKKIADAKRAVDESIAEARRAEAERAGTGLQSVQVFRVELVAGDAKAAFDLDRLTMMQRDSLARQLTPAIGQVLERARAWGMPPQRSRRV